MTLYLRQACVTDLPAIYRSKERYIQDWEPGHEAVWRSQLERHLTRWVENFERLTVAVIGENLVGYSLWLAEPPYAELATISVEPDYRRRGIGKVLLNRYVAAAAQQGFNRLRLSVRPNNPAKLMYQQASFVCTGLGAHDYLTYERSV